MNQYLITNASNSSIGISGSPPYFAGFILGPGQSTIVSALNSQMYALSFQGIITIAQLASTTTSTAVGTPVNTFHFTVTQVVTATQLPAASFSTGPVITASSSNSGVIYVGGSGVSSANGYPLYAGQSISFQTDNTNLIYVLGTSVNDVLFIAGN